MFISKTGKAMLIKLNGGLAQLGEHLLCKQGVIGSIPFTSTNSRSGIASLLQLETRGKRSSVYLWFFTSGCSQEQITENSSHIRIILLVCSNVL